MTQAGETLAAAEEDGQNAVDALRIVRYGRTHAAGGQSRSLTDEGSREVVEAEGAEWRTRQRYGAATAAMTGLLRQYDECR